jgi:hypothetical protein
MIDLAAKELASIATICRYDGGLALTKERAFKVAEAIDNVLQRLEAAEAKPTPSSPVSAPSPAGGVREALEALKLFADIANEYDDAEDDDFQVWRDFDVLGATLPLRNFRKARVAHQKLAALSSPATPEPVSAPAGEVAVEQAAIRIIRNRAEDGPAADRAVAHARQFDTDVWRDAKRDARAALSNPDAWGGGIMSGIREDQKPMLEAARMLMRRLFNGVLDKGGKPYAEHCERVEQRLPAWASEDARCAAILHDVIEDTATTGSDLIDAGFSFRTVHLVEKLSRRPEDGTYMEWIKAIAATGDAELIAIKLCDNLDNSDPERIAVLPPEQRDIVRRYERARRILEPALISSGLNLADATPKPHPTGEKEGRS